MHSSTASHTPRSATRLPQSSPLLLPVACKRSTRRPELAPPPPPRMQAHTTAPELARPPPHACKRSPRRPYAHHGASRPPEDPRQHLDRDSDGGHHRGRRRNRRRGVCARRKTEHRLPRLHSPGRRPGRSVPSHCDLQSESSWGRAAHAYAGARLVSDWV